MTWRRTRRAPHAPAPYLHSAIDQARPVAAETTADALSAFAETIGATFAAADQPVARLDDLVGERVIVELASRRVDDVTLASFTRTTDAVPIELLVVNSLGRRRVIPWTSVETIELDER